MRGGYNRHFWYVMNLGSAEAPGHNSALPLSSSACGSLNESRK